MKVTFGKGLSVAASVVLAVGLGGCGSKTPKPQPTNKGDAAACTTFNLAYENALNPTVASSEQGDEDALQVTLFTQAADQAVSESLREDILTFKKAYVTLTDKETLEANGDKPVDAAVEDLIESFLRIGDACEGEGVPLQGIDELREELGQSSGQSG